MNNSNQDGIRAAVLLIMLAALLMFCIVKGLGETPRRYEKRVERHLGSARHRLQQMSRFAPAAGPDAEYLRLADIDLALASDGLHYYQHGKISKADLDNRIKQLDRDMEDYPPQVANER